MSERKRREGGRRKRGPDPKNPERRLVVGRRFVLEALTGGTVDRIHVLDRVADKMPELAEAAAAAGVPLKRVDVSVLERLADGTRHQGVVAEGPPFPFRDLEVFDAMEAPLLVALDEIADPQNLGAIIRSALAFGAEGVIMPRHRSAPITPAVVRASAGATERATLVQVTNLQRALATLSDAGRQIVGLAADGDASVDALGHAPRGRVLVIGSEGSGLRRMVRERCDRLAAIPQLASFDSLNASVASAIALYEAARTRE